ncbi:MAG: acyl-CoA dehydrogenase family protein [Pseudomonadales bacterium]
MTLVLNEEQRQLQETAKKFVAEHAPVRALRKLRDDNDPLGYSKQLWQQMTELGFASITIPEAYDGLGFGFMGMGAVLEEFGRTLTASPLQASVVLGGSAIELAGSQTQKQALLPAIATGELTLALALEESHHHNPHTTATRAEKSGDQYILNGKKTFVLDGHSADKLIVVARTGNSEDAVSFLLVDANSEGVTRTRTKMIDSRNAARITLHNVSVPHDSVLGAEDDASAALAQVLDRGRICLAAEMLGGILEAFERTVTYLKDREQFGVKIGSFQALQHRAAIMYTEIELCKSVVIAALSALDEQSDDVPQLASLAKARVNDTYELVSNEAVQMHGGIGVTDDLEIGFFLKRARVAMQALGDAAFHRDRYATLAGY